MAGGGLGNGLQPDRSLVTISAPTGRILTKFDTWGIVRKSINKIQISLKSDENNGYFTGMLISS